MPISPLLAVYTVEGGLSAFLNGLLVLAILRYKKLRDRKEYVTIGSLALADCGNAMGFFLAGLQRSYYFHKGTLGEPASSWDCFTMYYNVFWYVCQPLCQIMLAVVSLDRLIATAAPLRYFTLTRKYAFIMCGVLWAFQMVQVPVLAVISYTNRHNPPRTRFCLAQDGIHESWYSTYLFGCGPVFGSISILLYVVIVFIQAFRGKQRSLNQDKNQSEKRQLRQREEDLRKQYRLMVTLGISSGFTLILVIIPFGINTLLVNLGESGFTSYSALLSVFNPMLNLFLYISRHAEMRAAVKAVLMCTSAKEMAKGVVSVTPNHQGGGEHTKF